MGTVKPPAVVTCEARLVHGGKTTQVWDAVVKDSEKNKLIAIFRCTQLIIY
jgi:acyl-coenzyme A thioesterase PaaI-like protein